MEGGRQEIKESEGGPELGGRKIKKRGGWSIH
jgi:hypothetical protein